MSENGCLFRAAERTPQVGQSLAGLSSRLSQLSWILAEFCLSDRRKCREVCWPFVPVKLMATASSECQ